MSAFAQLSARQMREVLKLQVAAEKKAAETERAEAFADVLVPVYEAVVSTTEMSDSDKAGSTWAGYDSRGHELVLEDGTVVSISFRVTDVKRTAEKVAVLEGQARAFLESQAAAAAATQG